MGSIPTLGKVDNGLMGIAVHPDFSRNRWIYFWYCPPQLVGQNRQLRLSRITATVDHKLDMASEKVLIQILGSKSDAYHSGGPMQFDREGNLWVTVGNNSPDLNPETLNVLSTTDSTQSAEWGPSNTASLRGGILRIRPDSSAKGYSVPKGNFGEHWAAEFARQGKGALAEQYRNPAKVLPEVYVKGNRSNYSLALHPKRTWLAWGEVNYSNQYDEFNLTDKPVFAGFPYFHAANAATGNHGKSAAAPANASPFNNGVAELPPAFPGTINNLANTAITGPLYAFDSSLQSDTKFPPQMGETWLTFGWASGLLHIHNLDAQGKVIKTTRADNGLLANLKLRKPLQARYGPEGALYVLNYDGSYNTINPSVTRVEYVGACKVPVAARPAVHPIPGEGIALEGLRLRIPSPGNHEMTLISPSGRILLSRRVIGGANYDLASMRREAGIEAGVYVLRIRSAEAYPHFSWVRSVALP
jgi:cytochrome c